MMIIMREINVIYNVDVYMHTKENFFFLIGHTISSMKRLSIRAIIELARSNISEFLTWFSVIQFGVPLAKPAI